MSRIGKQPIELPSGVMVALYGGFVICDGSRVKRFEPPMGLEAVAEALAAVKA